MAGHDTSNFRDTNKGRYTKPDIDRHKVRETTSGRDTQEVRDISKGRKTKKDHVTWSKKYLHFKFNWEAIPRSQNKILRHSGVI